MITVLEFVIKNLVTQKEPFQTRFDDDFMKSEITTVAQEINGTYLRVLMYVAVLIVGHHLTNQRYQAAETYSQAKALTNAQALIKAQPPASSSAG
jgi:hypothetical protein